MSKLCSQCSHRNRTSGHWRCGENPVRKKRNSFFALRAAASTRWRGSPERGADGVVITIQMGRRDPLAANRLAPSRAAPKAKAAAAPTVDAEKFQVLNCCGQLKKKSSGRLSGWTWKKWWLQVRLDVGDDENYALTYHKGPPDKNAAHGALALAGCAVRELEGSDAYKDFHVFDAHDAFELRAASTDERREWVATLRHVVAVAVARERHFAALNEKDDDAVTTAAAAPPPPPTPPAAPPPSSPVHLDALKATSKPSPTERFLAAAAVSPPAEDDHVTALAAARALPREYAVKAPGALLRAGLAMASARIRQLAPGDPITVEEVAVAPEGVPRARVSAPVEGWLSCKCVQGGEALAVIALRPPTPPTTPASPDEEFVIVEERTDSGTDAGSPYEEFEEFEEVSASSADDEAAPPPAEPVVAPPSPRTALDVAWSPPKPRKGRASEASEYSCAYELDLDRLAESDLTVGVPPTPLRRVDPLDSARRSPPSTSAETIAAPDPLGSAQRSPPSSTAGPPAHLDPFGVARSSRAGTRGPPDFHARSSGRRSP